MSRDSQSVNPIENEVISGDKIEVGKITESIAAIGNGAQVIVNQINEAYSAIAEMEKGIQAAEQHLATKIKEKVHRFIELAHETQLDDQSNPYKALLDYEIKDAPFFYGREDATKAMFEKLNRNNLTILHADSGSGKTSLLQAGLASRLLTQGHFPLYLRPYRQSPEKCIKKAFLSDYETLEELERFRDENMSLKGFLERVTFYLGDRKFFIFLDQFEEFFTELGTDKQQKFVDQLQECNVPDLNVRWVLSIRKEYFSNLAIFRTLKPFDNEYFLSTFTPEEAKEIINEPAVRKGVKYELGLIEKILLDIHQQSEGISPPQVQLVCYTLFEELHREEDPKLITFALYEMPRGQGRSGAEGILTNHLTNVLNKRMTAEERQMARRVLISLVASQKRRVVKSWNRLFHELKPNQPNLLNDVLVSLIENRLVRTDENDADETLYELSHDYLLDRIELTDRDKARKQVEELIVHKTENWQNGVNILFASKELELIESQKEELHIEQLSLQILIRSLAVHGIESTSWVALLSAEARLKFINELLAECQSKDKTQREQALIVLWSMRTYLPEKQGFSITRRYIFQRVLQTGKRWAVLLVILAIFLGVLVIFPFLEPVEGVRLLTNKVGDRSGLQVAHDSQNPDYLLLSDQTPGGLWRSKDGGGDFEHIGKGVLSTQQILQVATTQEIVYVVASGGVFIIRPDEPCCQQLFLPKGFVPRVVIASEDVEGEVFVGGETSILKITNSTDIQDFVLIHEDMGSNIQALSASSNRLIIATENGVWLHEGEKEWEKFPEKPLVPVIGLGLPYGGASYAFMIGLTDGSLKLADFKDSNKFHNMPYSLNLTALSSLSVTEDVWYAGTDLGLLCWRRWNIKNINWWRFHFKAQVPCLNEKPLLNS